MFLLGAIWKVPQHHSKIATTAECGSHLPSASPHVCSLLVLVEPGQPAIGSEQYFAGSPLGCFVPATRDSARKPLFLSISTRLERLGIKYLAGIIPSHHGRTVILCFFFAPI